MSLGEGSLETVHPESIWVGPQSFSAGSVCRAVLHAYETLEETIPMALGIGS
jgi:hypothetical protein